MTCPARGGPSTGSCASPTHSALRGVSSSPHCSQGLADTFLPACLGSKGMIPSPGWSCSTQRGKTSPTWHPMLPEPISVWVSTLEGSMPRVQCTCHGGSRAGGSSIPPGHGPGMERPAPGQTPVLGAELDVSSQHMDTALSLSSGKAGSRASSGARAQGAGGHCPLHTGQARVAGAKGAASAGGMCCCMGGRRSQQRNVLCHGQGWGERERKQQAGKINSVSPRATVLWSQFFSLLPLK